MCVGDVVWVIGVFDQVCVFDQFGCGVVGGVDWYDLVVGVMDDQCWDVEFFQVIVEVGMEEGFDVVIGGFVVGLYVLGEEVVDQFG